MTSELKAKDFLLHYLRKEYIKRSKVINNLVSHVEKLHKDYALTNIERTRHLKSINDLIKLLYISYKSRLDTIKGAQCINKHDDFNFELDDDNNSNNNSNNNGDFKLDKQQQQTSTTDVINITNITNLDKKLSDILKSKKSNISLNSLDSSNLSDLLDSLYNLSFSTYENELKKFCPNDFDNFDKKLQDLICSKEKDDNKIGGIGCKNIFDAVQSFSYPTNNLLDLDSDNQSLFDLLNSFFIPLTIECKKKDNKQKIKIIKQYNIPDKYDHLLGNFYKIEINIPHSVNFKQLHIYGFFESDCVSATIRSSQLCNTFLHNKKERFINLANGTIKLTKALQKLSSVPENFKEIYIQNMPIGDLIGFDDLTFVNESSIDNSFYQKYSSLGNFRSVFSDFIHADLITKFKIIKYLLLSQNSNNAGLLFSLTKESKTGSPVVADIIYKNLNLPLQLQLHKENISIKSEIEKLSSMDTDDIDMKKQIILNKNIPPKVKKLALEKLNEMKTGGSEYYKQLIYVKTIIDYPWIGENDSDIFTQFKNDQEKWREIMLDTKAKLDEKVYGHAECKDNIVELLAKWFTNPNSLGKSLALQGPPGIGKTMIAMELGKAIGIPFVKINLGGLEDGSVLTGHSSTYSGAVPGNIVKRMVEAGAPRCILFFDELDKTSTHHGHNEIYDVLIHVTDVTTNSQFNDKFFQDVTFPLNKALFVFSFNNKEKIDPILLDRMEIIKVDSYSVEDKIQIVNKHLIPDAKKDIGLSDVNIKISDENITYLIDTYTNEAGVRGIKRLIEKILSKLNKDKIFGVGIFEKNKNPKTIELTKELINGYLPKQSVPDTKIHKNPEVGYVNGLYATDSGNGGLVPVIMYKNQSGKGSKFTFKITGNLQKVMTDSVSLAFTIASNFIKPKYLQSFFENYPNGLHIHSGDLSTKKDGPSATTTFTIAFISKILNIKIKNNIAMTGECGGNGDITAIGGLHSKLIGSRKAGVNLVFAPKENEKDLEKIKKNDKTLIDDNFKVILVSHIKEILEYALIENENYEDGDSKNITYEKTFNCHKYLQNSCIRNKTNPILFDIETNDGDDKDSESNENSDVEEISESDNDSDSSSSSDRSK